MYCLRHVKESLPKCKKEVPGFKKCKKEVPGGKDIFINDLSWQDESQFLLLYLMQKRFQETACC